MKNKLNMYKIRYIMLEVDDDFEVHVTLQHRGSKWYAFVETTDDEGESTSAFLCRFVRRDDFTLDDLPTIVRKEVEWMLEDDGEKATIKEGQRS